MKRSVCILAMVALVVAVLGPALAQEAASGQALYDKKCALCHGKDGVAKSTAKGSGNFNDPAWQGKNSVDTIVQITTEGKKDTKMVAYKDKLKAEEIKAIADYIKTLK